MLNYLQTDFPATLAVRQEEIPYQVLQGAGDGVSAEVRPFPKRNSLGPATAVPQTG